MCPHLFSWQLALLIVMSAARCYRAYSAAASYRRHAHTCINWWFPSSFLITNTVIIITIIIIVIMITIILIAILSSRPPIRPILFIAFFSLPPPPALFSTGGRINIHLGPYTSLVSDGVSGRAVWRLQAQWPTTESREKALVHTEGIKRSSL